MKKALDGITVLDFSQLLAGPYATMMLGDIGANVIKIERIGKGDIYRDMTFFNKFFNGKVSPVFLAWNRNKRSLAIDLKDPLAKETIYKMVKRADVVIHNFRPGVMERLGYGYEQLKEINQRIVYGSNSGFGATGPYATRPGQDMLAQGLSGIMCLTGRKGSPPTPLGTGIADQLSAYHLVYGILAAIIHRERTGEGQKVEVDLFRSMLAFQSQELLCAMNLDIEINKPDSGIGLPGLDAPYGVYACSDGYITIAMNDFPTLVDALGDKALLRYNDKDILYYQRDEVFREIEAITKTKTKAHWLRVMLEKDLWVSEVKHTSDIEHDLQVEHMNLIRSYNHPDAGEVKVIGPAVTLSETPAKIELPPPRIGEHSRAILEEFGIDDRVIEKMINNGIVSGNSKNSNALSNP